MVRVSEARRVGMYKEAREFVENTREYLLSLKYHISELERVIENALLEDWESERNALL